MKYITKEGDRWDQISYKFYGHPDYYREIFEANHKLPVEVRKLIILPAGIELEIPEIDLEIDYPEELPPWKR